MSNRLRTHWAASVAASVWAAALYAGFGFMRLNGIWRVEDGRFVEHWDKFNTLDIFIQVDAVPPTGEPS